MTTFVCSESLNTQIEKKHKTEGQLFKRQGIIKNLIN
jgi:hypothetical protein